MIDRDVANVRNVLAASQTTDDEKVVCGYLTYRFEDANIYNSKSDRSRRENGMGVVGSESQDAALSNLDNRFGCVRGVVYYRGCVKDKICTNSPFLFAIKVTDVED